MEDNVKRLLVTYLKLIHEDISALRFVLQENIVYNKWMETHFAHRGDLRYGAYLAPDDHSRPGKSSSLGTTNSVQ